MHRQSLGSSASKLQTNHGGKEEKPNDEPHKETLEEEEEEGKKREKQLRSSCRTEKLVHLIPVLIFLCMFVLYVFSHDPSQKDTLKIAGSGRFFGSKESVNLGRTFGEKKRGDVISAAAIYGHRSLQQTSKKNQKLRSTYMHRKFGDF